MRHTTAAPEAGFSTPYKRYVLACLTAVYTLNLVDRGLMTLVLQPIKVDLNLSDTQLGFLTGIAFGLFYATLGVPIARLSDRGNRVTITSAAIGIWALTVMSCLFVTSFVQLAFARVAAAVGESGCKPPTYSLVGDYFKGAAERARAMAIYITGSPLSNLLSLALGGWLTSLYGWRMAFVLIGIPGILLALIVRFTVAEPRQRAASRLRNAYVPPLGEVVKTLWLQRSFRHIAMGMILFYTLGLGMHPWYAAFLMRSHGMGTTELGVWLGVVFSVSGIVGVLVGGYAAARWFANNERAQMRMSAVLVACLVPCYVAFLLLPQKQAALLSLIPLMLVFNMFLGPTYALMQRLVADEMRATMMAIVMLFANLIGFGIGPQVVGILSDQLAPALATDSLRYAMLAMSVVALWAAYHFWRVSEFVAEDLQRVGQGVQHAGEPAPAHAAVPGAAASK